MRLQLSFYKPESLSSVPTSNITTNTNTNTTTEDDKHKRFDKYYRTYRYIQPAHRFSFNKAPDKSCGLIPDFTKYFNLNHKFRSRLNEDKIIYETFFKNNHVTNGTFIELGAFDGQTESNTRFFDLCLGWKGLLIEGNPVNYQNTIRNRPNPHKMSFAPSCDAAYEAINKTVEFYAYPMTNVGMESTVSTYKNKPKVKVPCGPLAPVLMDVFDGHESIQFFSLDVEGAEYMVLQTINFKAIRFDVLMIEIQNHDCRARNCKVRQQVRQKMREEGYLRYEGMVTASDVYVHPKSPYQIPESVRKPNLP